MPDKSNHLFQTGLSKLPITDSKNPMRTVAPMMTAKEAFDQSLISVNENKETDKILSSAWQPKTGIKTTIL
jgi:hypothetical protein